MKIEYEATFTDIDIRGMLNKLSVSSAQLIRPRFLQRRTTMRLPMPYRSDNTWLRIRDEGIRITLALKAIQGKGISAQKELQVEVSSYEQTVMLLEAIGAEKKSEQESFRELWRMGECDITIDEWPFLEPYMEIEGKSEEKVRKIAEDIGLSWSRARFDNVSSLYSEKYNIPLDFLDSIKELAFNGQNPFI